MFAWGRRTYVMGILNMTPDSFSGDGLGSNLDRAAAQAQAYVYAGADLLDVGGESTRPGAAPVAAEEEMARVIPAITRLARELHVPLSVDTYKAGVARAAVAAGATIINDVWGLRMEPEIAHVAAETGAYLVITRNARPSAQAAWNYASAADNRPETGLIERVLRDLQESMALARRAGVAEEHIILDPGIGFGNTPAGNLEILRDLARLRHLGRPILIGTSRKGFIGQVLGLEVDGRLEGTAATVAIAIAHGADIVRVHDLSPMVRVSRMADAIMREPQVTS
ncbi:MAG: dihydropteroate synthase [Chloroflexi bacterium]|nr:dihydropteroate synthase [Chloroflexota bacterium]